MYMPPHFNSQDRAIAAELMRAHPFASLISTDDEGLPFVTHLPLVLDDRGEEGGFALLGHCAKPNPQWRHLQARPKAVATFLGPHAYMSPSVYPDLARVPTWNYLAVHCTVEARLIETPVEKDALLKRLIGEHEPAYAQQWRDLGEEFQLKMLDGIVGFELQVTAAAMQAQAQPAPARGACRDVRALQHGHAGRAGAGSLDAAARHEDRCGAGAGELKDARARIDRTGARPRDRRRARQEADGQHGRRRTGGCRWARAACRSPSRSSSSSSNRWTPRCSSRARSPMTPSDEHWMRLALDEARRAAEAGEVPVGAVLVKEGAAGRQRAQRAGRAARPQRPCRDECAARGRRGAGQLPARRLRALRDAGAVRDVRGRHAARAARARGVRRGRSEDRRRRLGARPVRPAAAQPPHAGAGRRAGAPSARRCCRTSSRAAAAQRARRPSLCATMRCARRPSASMRWPDYGFAPHYVSDLPEPAAAGACTTSTKGRPTPPGPACACTGRASGATSSGTSRASAGLRVLAPDLIGFGRSDKPKREAVHRWDWHCDVLLEWLERLRRARSRWCYSAGAAELAYAAHAGRAAALRPGAGRADGRGDAASRLARAFSRPRLRGRACARSAPFPRRSPAPPPRRRR